MRGRFAIALACVLAAAPVDAARAARTGPEVVSAGAVRATAAGRVLRGIVGQLAVGASAGSGIVARQGFWGGGAVELVPVDVPPAPPAPTAALAFAFGAPTPNPSRGPVTFDLTLPAAATVELEVFDVGGRRVGGLPPARTAAGRWALRWEPQRGGVVQGAGVYFARLRVDGLDRGTRRVTRLR